MIRSSLELYEKMLPPPLSHSAKGILVAEAASMAVPEAVAP